MGDGLQVEHAVVRFGDTLALDDVGVEVAAGRTLAVLGPSGCGKSTLLRVVAGLQRLDAGRVLFDGVDLGATPTHKRGFSLMFQDGQLFQHLRVGENIAYPMRRQGVPRSATGARVQELLALVGLPGIADRRPGELSGGQQQRVALARALAARPRLLLLDEPLSALDRSLRERLAGDLRGILTATSTTTMFVTHDHAEALTLADELAVMSHGRIVRSGPTEQVWRDPGSEAVARFLGYSTVLSGQAARALRDRAPVAAASSYALRDNAFRVTPDGDWTGVIASAGATPTGTRLTVAVDGLGPVPAVSDADPPALPVGASVLLRLSPQAVTSLPGTAGP